MGRRWGKAKTSPQGLFLATWICHWRQGALGLVTARWAQVTLSDQTGLYFSKETAGESRTVHWLSQAVIREGQFVYEET